MTEILMHGVQPGGGTERLENGRVKGAVIRAHIEWVRDYNSRADVIALFEEMPRALRQQISTLAPGPWYPFATLIAVDRMIVERFGGGRLQFAGELGAYFARRTLAETRPFLLQGALHDFFGRAALLYREWYDFGSAEYVKSGSRSGCMLRRGYGAHSPMDCAATGGFHRECIRLHGYADAAVRESACRCRADGFCAFELSWAF